MIKNSDLEHSGTLPPEQVRPRVVGKKLGLIIIIIWTLFLLVLMLAPFNKSPVPPPLQFKFFDKVAHFGLFAITGIILILGARFLRSFKSRFIFGAVIGLSLAVGTEVGQHYIPYRYPDIYDLIADVLGVLSSLTMVFLLYRNRLFNRFFII